MSIDSGLGLTFNENYPVAGANQSSQGFRDNFTVIKRAVENLQTLRTTASSVLTITPTLTTSGSVRLDVTYPNNAFVLPVGNPTVTASAGMLRQNGPSLQFHDGAFGWRNVVFYDVNGGGLSVNGEYLSLPAGPSSARPSVAIDGMIRFNSDTSKVESFSNGAWQDVGVGAGGSGLSINDVRQLLGNATSYPQTAGVDLEYDQISNRFFATPRTFKLTIAGAVQGNATITGLNDTTINVTGFDARGVKDLVSGFLVGTITNTDSGVTVHYNPGLDVLELGAREFTVTLDGAIQGSATITRLQNAVVHTTTTDLIKGLTVYDEVTPTGLPQTVKELKFTGNSVSVAQTANTATITVFDGLSRQDIRDTVVDFVHGVVQDQSLLNNTDTGVTIFYDTVNSKLNFGVRDFTISLSGDVVGSTTISKLQNGTISATLPNHIKGLTFKDEGTPTGLPQTVQVVNFVGAGVTATQTGNTATITVPQGLTLADVRTEVGGFVVGTSHDPNTSLDTETGITVNFDTTNQKLELGVRDFAINLTGAVTGNATVSRLHDVTINTVTDRIKGITVQDEGISTGLSQTVQFLNFVGSAVTASQSGNVATISFSTGLSLQDVRDAVGGFISGTQHDPNTSLDTETGITVNYDTGNNRLELGVRDFQIALAGDVQGSALVHHLGNATITTTAPGLLKGITVEGDGLALGLDQSVTHLNFTGGGLNFSQTGNVATIDVPTPPTVLDIQNTVGSFIRGTIRDPSTSIQTESGITVNYDSQNDALELGVRSFNIALTGAVTGNATVNRLQSVSIDTTSDAINGLVLKQNNILLGRTVTTVNVVGGTSNAATVSGNTLTLNLSQGIDTAAVQGIVSSMVLSGSQHGIEVSYDNENQQIGFDLDPISVSLTGAIAGSGTIHFDGSSNSGKLSIATTVQDLGFGLSVLDEGLVRGTAVTAINFVGGGVTSAVSISGAVATVFVPNSPGNESFLVTDSGSANIPNSRKLTAGSGILFNDGGPGGDFIISAEADGILARSQFTEDGVIVGERSRINIISTNEIVVDVEDDATDNQINLAIYSLADGWWRKPQTDMGLVTDKYGPSIDFGGLGGGIIEGQADLGLVTDGVS